MKDWETVYLGSVTEALDPANPDVRIGDDRRNYWFGPEKLNSWTSWVKGTFNFETYGVKHEVLLGDEYYTNNLDYHVTNGVIDTVNIFSNDVPQITNAQLNQFRSEAPAFFISTESTSKTIYLQDHMTFWDKLHLMAGFRFDWVDREQNLSFWDDPSTPVVEGKDAC